MFINLWMICGVIFMVTYFLIKLFIKVEALQDECRRNHGKIAEIFYEASETGEDLVKVYLKMRH